MVALLTLALNNMFLPRSNFFLSRLVGTAWKVGHTIDGTLGERQVYLMQSENLFSSVGGYKSLVDERGKEMK